jgi:hypothetical protein
MKKKCVPNKVLTDPKYVAVAVNTTYDLYSR